MSIRLRLLGRELKKLRIQAGLTQEQVADLLKCSIGRINYTEQGKGSRPTIEFIRTLLDLYGVSDETVREPLVDLARRSRQRGWWTTFPDIFPAELPGCEEDATLIRVYDNVVPGLLQTRDYAKAMFSGGLIYKPEDLDRQINARTARGHVLQRDNPPKFWAVLDEAALRRLVGGPEVMLGQLSYLLEMASRPHITIQILSFDAGASPALDGAFSIFDFGGLKHSPLVYAVATGGSAFLEEPEQVERCTLVFNQAVMAAQSPDESMRLMWELLDQLKGYPRS